LISVQRSDGVERSPRIGIQMRLPWGILHMALTRGVVIY